MAFSTSMFIKRSTAAVSKGDTYSGREWTELKMVKEELWECLGNLSILKFLGPYFGGLKDGVVSSGGFGKSRREAVNLEKPRGKAAEKTGRSRAKPRRAGCARR